MQIALTKKLADGMKIKPSPAATEENPLFTWTANWMTTWENRRAEDMLVLVNHATRFAVVVYQVKRKDLKNMDEIVRTAISNTLLAMNIHAEVIDEYLEKAGEIEFVKNSDRKATAWLKQAGQAGSIYVWDEYNGVDKVFDDALGAFINNRPVNYSKSHKEGFFPEEEMIRALSEFTGKSVYNYKAFELLVTLDLEVYKATRRIIVPANIDFYRLHKVLQNVFDWKNYHLYDFTVLGENKFEPTQKLVPFEEALDYDIDATLMGEHVLSDYFPKVKEMLYRYDMGDYWVHNIEWVRVIEGHDEASPYLLEADGQTPPEDVGGVSGFNSFREIMLDPDHPEYKGLKEWAGFWDLELRDWDKKPKVIDA